MADKKVDSLFFRLTKASHRLAFVTPLRDRGNRFTDKCICLEAVLFGHSTVETYRLLHKRRKR
ncbi:hypothetical protein HNQ34_001268 [Anoxybacillus tepidamans]|uniref:Uncharacterized protein n=1 Tax=Anoxybacteroides tepidamans TaxID=265948 RepID=A0A7W8IPA6_9BACL|nr:hypothetical protein [Anoxybacillus tepidamans]